MAFFVDGITTTPEGKIHARRIGEYWTYDEAVAAAKHVIDTFLFHEYTQTVSRGVSAKQLLSQYRRTGEVPFVLRKSETSTNVSRFDHLAYAAKRCAEICGGNKDS